MRIAIFHDYIGAIGGGEKLVLTLAGCPGADVTTRMWILLRRCGRGCCQGEYNGC